MRQFLGFGVGLRPAHYTHILENKVTVDWFEIVSENFMGLVNSGRWGRHLTILEKIRAQYPVVMHGVSLSIGSTDELNFDYLKRLKALATQIEPAWISDHLCWTGVNGENLHDLLPLPYTHEAIEHIVSRIHVVQDYLKRPFTFENVSAYLNFSHSEMTEWEFVSEIAKKSGCKVLLDVNNVYVSSVNNKFDPYDYLNGISIDSVQQIHLAGHTNCGTHLIDTHDHPVFQAVWELYEYAVRRFGKISTMIEWDADIPAFSILEAEVEKARSCFRKVTDESSHRPSISRSSEVDALGNH